MELRYIKIAFFLIVSIGLLGASGCGGSDQPDTQTTDLTENTDQTTDQADSTDLSLSGDNLLTIDPSTQTAEINQGIDLAKKKAKEWQSNAQMVAAQIDIPPSLKNEYTSTRYIYTSTNNNFYYWTIALTAGNQNYIRALIPKEDYLNTDLKIVLPEFWKINYVEALQIVEQNGGATWRESNSLGGITMTLSRGQPNSWLYWNVEYLAVGSTGERQPTENLKVKLNAYSGEVTTE